MTYRTRICPECQRATERDIWVHVGLFALLLVVGFVIGCSR
jgi:hypothetical protein